MANDHYVVLLEIMFWFLAVVVLFGEKQKRRIGFSVFLFLVALFGFAESVNHTGYSVSALVRWLPVPLSLICIALSMSYPDALRHLRENKTGWIIFLGLSVFCIAFGFTDIRSLEYRHKDVKAYGQVYEYLRSKPRGVVMADHYVASSAAIYTGHAVYWDQMAFTDPVKNEDLFLRYYDNRLFFESDKFFEGIESESVLFGVPDRCGQYVRLKWLTVYPLLNKIMYPYDKFCDEVARMRKLNTAQIDSTYVDFKDGLRRSNKWNPVFKLDWLIKNEKEFDELPQYLRSCFKLDKSFDGTGVYRSVCSSI